MKKTFYFIFSLGILHTLPILLSMWFYVFGIVLIEGNQVIVSFILMVIGIAIFVFLGINEDEFKKVINS